MSVCFFVPAADQAAASSEETEQDTGEEVAAVDTSQLALQQFWHNVMEDIKKVTAEDFKTQALPLARIKKIMKLDEEVKMISAEAPVMFAKAAEIFIHELTLRAWSHTEDNKRRTLQRNDITMAISKSDQFDFLIDIVPRHEVKPSKPREDEKRPAAHTDQYYLQLAQQQAAALNAQPQQFIIQQPGAAAASAPAPAPAAHIVQQTSSGGGASAAGMPTVTGAASGGQPVTLLQQIVTASGELQQIPIQLTQAQLNMIRLQVQNNPSQPIVIQTQQQSPQIIQVTSQGQPQSQQVFLAQVSAQDDS